MQIHFFCFFPTMIDIYFGSFSLELQFESMGDENELSLGCAEYLKPWFSLNSRFLCRFHSGYPLFIENRMNLTIFIFLHVLLFTILPRNSFHNLSVRRRKIQRYNLNLLLQSLAVLLTIISMLLTKHYFF